MKKIKNTVYSLFLMGMLVFGGWVFSEFLTQVFTPIQEINYESGMLIVDMKNDDMYIYTMN